MDSLITVETDLFEHRLVKPHFINPCCFGEDFAAWLIRELAPLTRSRFRSRSLYKKTTDGAFGVGVGRTASGLPFHTLEIDPRNSLRSGLFSVAHDPRFNLIKRLFRKPDQQALQTLSDRVRHGIMKESTFKILPNPIIQLD